MKLIKTLEWKDGTLRIIDQTKLPKKLEILALRNYKEVLDSIKALKIRGAPAIGIAAAFGMMFGARDLAKRERKEFMDRLEGIGLEFKESRPTALSISSSVKAAMEVARSNIGEGPQGITDKILSLALNMIDEDLEIGEKIGRLGVSLLKRGDSILTHCNAGALATAGSGTALSILRVAALEGYEIHVFVTETRPVLQGSRLTAWELKEYGIKTTLITDNMVGYFMKEGSIDVCLVGADRIASNGDVANKIGTYSIAVLAKEHGIPFYVAAPLSTIDTEISSGEEIKIEERSPREVTHIGDFEIAPEGINVKNPAFDITPRQYIKAIITESSIIKPPYKENIKVALRG